jgi:hypothetical protein
MNSWKQAIAYVSCAAVFLGFCSYIMFRVMLLSAPTVVPGLLPVTKTTLFSDAFPWFFWTATGFVGISLVLGVFVRYRTRAWKTIFYVYGVFLIAFVIEVAQTIAFIVLINAIPISGPPYEGGIQASELFGFFVLPFLLPLYCFYLGGAGLGLYIGRQVRHAEPTS